MKSVLVFFIIVLLRILHTQKVINIPSIISRKTNIAEIIGLDGVILLAFILSFPANETVLPIILMGYTCSAEIADATSLSFISETLIANNWTFLTALNVMIFSVLHFPCATTLKTIKAETGSIKWTILAFILPTLCGLFICFLTNLLFNIIS